MTNEREEYLRALSEDFGVTYEQVVALAELLGECEDYDGLLTSLEDLGELYE